MPSHAGASRCGMPLNIRESHVNHRECLGECSFRERVQARVVTACLPPGVIPAHGSRSQNEERRRSTTFTWKWFPGTAVGCSSMTR